MSSTQIKMNELIRLVYIVYLGKEMGIRLGAICQLVKEHNGRGFFEKYSTPNDSILQFLKKCEARGLLL